MPALPDATSLRDIPLFAGLEREQLEQVNQRLRMHRFPAGTNVMTAETPGETVYIIYTGTVKIKMDTADGDEVIIALLGAGDIVGEMSVIDSAGRSADVLTIEDSRLLWLDRSAFNDLVDSIPLVARNLLKILSGRVRMSTGQIVSLCTHDVYGRVAHQILVFADRYGVPGEAGVTIPIRLTQSDFAGLVGASRERVNQQFVALRNSKLISVDHSYRITVHNIERLREIVRSR